MKVRITRTSFWDHETPPIESAFKSKLPKYRDHYRTCKTFEEFDQKFAVREGTWLSKGINHQIRHGMVYRQDLQEGYGWYLRFKSLKELYRFIEANGQCVLSIEDGEMKLEIYDSYRE